jgi:hypothetical protein
VLFTLGELRLKPTDIGEAFFQEWVTAAQPHLSSYSPAEVAVVFWTLGRCMVREVLGVNMCIAFAKVCQLSLDRMEPQHLAFSLAAMQVSNIAIFSI